MSLKSIVYFLHLWHISIWMTCILSLQNPLVNNAAVSGNPGFTVFVRASMGARQWMYFSVIGRVFLVRCFHLGSHRSKLWHEDLSGCSLFWSNPRKTFVGSGEVRQKGRRPTRGVLASKVLVGSWAPSCWAATGDNYFSCQMRGLEHSSTRSLSLVEGWLQGFGCLAYGPDVLAEPENNL